MDKTVLVERDLRNGERLIEALDASGFEVKSALWLFDTDLGVWRLYIASPIVEDEGPIKAYGGVQSVLRDLCLSDGLSLDDIALVSPRHPIIQLFKGNRIESVKDPVEFSHTTVKNVFIGKAHLYRAL